MKIERIDWSSFFQIVLDEFEELKEKVECAKEDLTKTWVNLKKKFFFLFNFFFLFLIHLIPDRTLISARSQ